MRNYYYSSTTAKRCGSVRCR